MPRFENNLTVVGAGSAGLVAAMVGTSARAKVSLIERNEMGGDCLNTGCVPSKTLIASARVAHMVRHAELHGVKVEGAEVNFPHIMERIHQTIATIAPNDSVDRYTQLGVDCVLGNAVLTGPHTVVVDGREISTRSIVLAIGAKPQNPSIPGLSECNPLNSESVWSIRELPEKLVVIGGGPIGCELAQAFARLGSEVAIVEQQKHILPDEDKDAANLILETLKKEGITVHTGSTTVLCDTNRLTIEFPHGTRTLNFDRLLVATGRTPRYEGMGLESVGIRVRSNGSIAVNDYLQTSVKSIYACGDVVGPYQFTHMASHQAWYAAANALARPFWRFKLNQRVVPWAVFTDPELARVGMGEKELRKQNIPYQVTRVDFEHSDRALTEGLSEGFVKLFTPTKSDKLLGACIVGSNASELIISCIHAMTHNYGLNKILATIHVYPTRTESIRLAAGDFRRKNIPEYLLKASETINALMR